MSDEAFTRRTTLAKLGGAVLSAAGGGSFLAGEASGGNRAVETGQVACVLAPELTEGPYDVAGETLRRDIRDDHPGTRPSLHLRAACTPGRESRIGEMPAALHFTDDPAACALLAEDPFALLVGFAIDQQVPVPKAFAGPYVLRKRAGTLEPAKLAAMDLGPIFAEKPAIHRFPGAMATRVRELAAVVAEDYGGDASRIWNDAADGADLRERIGSLPGFGEMKIRSLGAVLAKQFGVEAAKDLAPDHPTLGDVTSPDELQRYQLWKREYKKASKGA